MSQPRSDGRRLEWLSKKLVAGSKVLDVGSGSGFLTAVMYEMVKGSSKKNGTRIVGVEHIDKLAKNSILNLLKSYSNEIWKKRIRIVNADGRKGYKQEAPYDVIHVDASAKEVPEELIKQLKVGGLMVIPIGE